MKQTESYQHCLAGGLSYGSNGLAWRSCSHFGPDPQHVDSSMVIRWRCVVTFLVSRQENSAEIMNCNDTCMFDVRHVKANVSTGINPQVCFSTYDDSWFFEFNSGFCEAMLEIWFAPDDVWFLCLVQNFMSYIYYENYEIHCSFSSVRSKHRELQASIACLSFLIAGDLGFQKMHRTIWTSYLGYHITLRRKPADIWQEMFQGSGRGVICNVFFLFFFPDMHRFGRPQGLFKNRLISPSWPR